MPLSTDDDRQLSFLVDCAFKGGRQAVKVPSSLATVNDTDEAHHVGEVRRCHYHGEACFIGVNSASEALFTSVADTGKTPKDWNI
jgi:hypothetical protein